jgi:hypothetical protein
MTWTWPWYVKQASTKTSIGTGDGCLCERCITPAMIFLNGRLLCWDHYCEETRTAHTQAPETGTPMAKFADRRKRDADAG